MWALDHFVAGIRSCRNRWGLDAEEALGPPMNGVELCAAAAYQMACL